MDLKQFLAAEGRRIGAQLRKTLLRLRIGNRWHDAAGDFGRRHYPSYDHYVAHQRTKLDAFRASSVARHDRKFYQALSDRLAASPVSLQGLAVLCLAARRGGEVRAFIAQGAFAVGIDLNPGRDNRFVLPGDFHDLQFASGSVDVVYTNSLDHAFDPDRLLAEVRRVLAPEGILIVEAGSGGHGVEGRGFYESFSWASIQELVRLIEAAGFHLEAQQSFDLPAPGEHMRFRRAA